MWQPLFFDIRDIKDVRDGSDNSGDSDLASVS